VSNQTGSRQLPLSVCWTFAATRSS
jgi:hypothetical protein